MYKAENVGGERERETCAWVAAAAYVDNKDKQRCEVKKGETHAGKNYVYMCSCSIFFMDQQSSELA